MRMPSGRLTTHSGAAGLLAASLVTGWLSPSWAAGAGEVFPEPRPATRAEAVDLLCDDDEAPGRCLRARIHRAASSPLPEPPAVRRAIALLGRGIVFAEERVFLGPDELPIRYTRQGAAFDRVDRTDEDGSGTADVLEATARGLRQARDLLVGQLELPRPALNAVWLVELGDAVDGYVVPSRADGRAATLVLDATPPGGVDGARAAAIRLYALQAALGLGPEMPIGWAEAASVWATIAVDGTPDAATLELLSGRLQRLDAGLASANPRLAAGNALWLAYLEEAHGRTAVRLTLEELAKTASVPVALDRAVRRASRDDLASAFRDFHLWSVLVGDRSDGRHFAFAGRLDSPAFAATRDGLPALSVQAEPPLAPLGAAHVRLRPDADRGGLRLHFEGDFDAAWEADLLWVGENGALHRLPLAVSPEGRAEITVPLRGLREALLLVRNLGGAAPSGHRYSYTARREIGFPYELATLEAGWVGGPTPGVLVRWETASERLLVGFNVARRRVDSSQEQVVNPVWVPAVGSAIDATVYRFLDRSAEPGVAYEYRILGITSDGLLSASDPIEVTAPAP